MARQVAVPASRAQLENVVELFAAAADRCRRGELDGVEISLAHGLLLASFLSPLTNHRDDEFGGSFENRLTLSIQVIDAVREALSPEMILGIRLGADDLVEGGLHPAEAATVAHALEERVDFISVMVGNNNRLEARVRHWPPTPAKHGLFRDVARVVKDAVAVPVCAVGRVTTVELANDILAAGDADLVGMVRAQIADPELLAKTRAGHPEDVRPCVGVNVCVNGLLQGRRLTCFVNRDVGHEEDHDANLTGKSAVAVGGGPAGLEAARRMARAGAEVTLAEAAGQLGGQVTAWSLAPSRSEVADYIDWQARTLQRLGVQTRLGRRVDASWVQQRSPDLFVIATGSRPAPFNLPSDDSVRVVDPLTALREGVKGDVLVFDAVGELDGALLAERLASDEDRQVTLVISRLHVGEGDGINTLFPMLRRLAELDVHVVERARPTCIDAGTVTLEGVFGENAPTLEAAVLVPGAAACPSTTSLRPYPTGAHKWPSSATPCDPGASPTPSARPS